MRLDAKALWDASTEAGRRQVRTWSEGLLTRDGTPLVWAGSSGTQPPYSDARVRYKIFSLWFDISNRVFDYAGRERPPSGLSDEERSRWVGRKPLPPKAKKGQPSEAPPGRQPATLIVTDGVAVHVFARDVPAPPAADADTVADADAGAGAPAALLARCRLLTGVGSIRGMALTRT